MKLIRHILFLIQVTPVKWYQDSKYKNDGFEELVSGIEPDYREYEKGKWLSQDMQRGISLGKKLEMAEQKVRILQSEREDLSSQLKAKGNEGIFGGKFETERAGTHSQRC